MVKANSQRTFTLLLIDNQSISKVSEVRIRLSVDRNHPERIFTGNRRNRIFRMGLGALGIVATDTHLPVVDVQPDHIFLFDAAAMNVLRHGGDIIEVFDREIPGADT